MPSTQDLVDGCLLCVIVAHVLICPFTKVEESFNMQAMHDILEHGADLPHYDHNIYPGVVPRTFVGALGVSALALPLHELLRLLEGALPGGSLVLSQYLCRSILGGLCWLSYRNLRKSINAKFGSDAGFYFGVLHCLQFHVPFYCSRSLPNTFALALSTLSHSLWLDGSRAMALYVTAVATVIFRCDIVLLLGPMAGLMLLGKEVPFWPMLLSGLLVAVAALSVSVLVDSIFWDRWVYPEGEVLTFNTVENKSSEWGVSPWHWYFSSALPKGLLVSMPLCLCGALGVGASARAKSTTRASSDAAPSCSPHLELLYYMLPASVFVVLYSFLPHKELRFIMPVFPVFTMGAAVALSWLSPARARNHGAAEQAGWSSLHRPVFAVGCIVAVMGSLFLLQCFTSASHYNYPGGIALQRLHEALPASPTCNHALERPVRVHIDVRACISGVTRFAQKRS
ncbi:unnamed protein product, partial [Ectocarpus fasciculatus]